MAKKEKGGFWVGLAAAIFFPMTRILARRKFVGLEHIPFDRPVLVVANHISYLDPVYSAVFVRSARRVPRFLAKASLWKIPVLGQILKGSGQIPVHRGSVDARRSLQSGLEALGDGKVVVIYPEGTITRDPEVWPMHSHVGVGRLAVDHCVNGEAICVPMVHWNTHLVFDKYKKKLSLFPRKNVTIKAGPPLDLSRFQGREVDADLLREVTDHLMGEVRTLLAEVRQETAPTEFYTVRKKKDAEPGEAADKNATQKDGEQ
ncbi:lysophospholipid acyltransferase family protein [Crossiella cryophila]|uniref:1-acyl-sn-glycerol-3-phosphate acyltransferase n=1 Tax=Crossiella cryophila TaxID=43355 RepID=A0A7W7CJ40_9PSEU|nr:lysophospholipid acyltransferase family protein [Crossiella cryophila]MBB4682136.1 1-acyl-sn-glycerol-3-phosphate acyltransferase [Crossiella cryophila]